MGVLRVRILDREDKVPPRGVLLVGRSPLASFPALTKEILLPPLQVRKIPFRFGRARLVLPKGLAVALSWGDKPWFGWRGPFFAGQTVILREKPPAALTVRVRLPGKQKKKSQAWLDLFLCPPRGTGMRALRRTRGLVPGDLVLKGLPPGKARYVLRVEGRTPLGGKLDLPPGKTLAITLAPPTGATLKGRILVDPPEDLKRQGRRFSVDGMEFPWTWVDGRGRFRMTGVPRDGKAHKIEVYLSPRRAPAVFWWPLPGSALAGPVEVRLPRPFLLKGKVLLPGGEPAAGRKLVLLGERLTSLGRTSWAGVTETGPSGGWEIAVPPEKERAVLLVLSPKGGPAGMVLTPPLQGKMCLDLGVLRLPLGTRLAGKVRSPGGKGISGAQVSLLPPPGSPGPSDLLERKVSTAPDGSFLFLGVAKGRYVLQARFPGRAGVRRPLRVGAAPLELDLPLPRGLVVPGEVLLPGGKPAPGARISFEPLAQGWTPVVVLADSKGRFLARGVPAVPCRVRAAWTRTGFHWSAVTVFPGKPQKALVLRLFREP